MARASRGSAVLLGLLLALPAGVLAGPVLDALPAYGIYVSPLEGNAGETNIGVNPYTNNAFFLRLTHLDRVTWDDTVTPPAPLFEDVTPFLNAATFDPILWTDRVAGRTFVVHLRITHNMVTFTDHLVGGDGELWVPTEPPTTFPFFDHQSFATGPHALPILGQPLPADDAFPAVDPISPVVLPGALHAAYVCAQLGLAMCMRSDDGGLTWAPYVPINLLDTCGGLTGQVKVDSIGTVYVPNKNCGGNGQGVHVSRDNGVTWTTEYIPGTAGQLMDPFIAIGTDDTVWMAMRNNGRPMITKSTDHGQTWSPAVNVDPSGTIVNTVFPMLVAGDAGRAAFGFYGSPDAGDYQSSSYTGVWHVYVSTTLDGGATWTLQDLTPNDPVQRGCIWLQGGGNACRNLLDFQSATLDAQGRVLLGYADGCISAKCVGPDGVPGDSRASKGTIARQHAGPRMLAAFDV